MRYLRSIAASLPSAMVLCVFASLLAWGHEYRWKIPRLSTLTGNTEPASPSPNPQSVAPISTGESAYRIQLASPLALERAGILTSELRERELTHQVTAHGIVDYDQTRYAEVSPRAAGTIWAAFKQEGDLVEAGDLLALVACPDVVTYKTGLLQALLQVEAREHTFKRLQASAAVIAERQLLDAERDLREARIRLFDEQQRLTNLGLPVATEELLRAPEAEVVEKLRTAGVPPAALRGVDRSTLPNNLLPLYAPFKGEIVHRNCTIGEMAAPSQVQFVVADISRLWILLDVRLEDADLLVVGQQVSFQPDGSARREVQGRINWVSPGVDKKTRRVRVRAEVSRVDSFLRPETFGTGRIVVRANKNCLAVPAAAIQQDGDDRLVFVQIGRTEFEGRRIRTGALDGGFVEVNSGLRAGEDIVVAGSHVLKSEILRSRLAND